jgi:hypothetical protein
MDVHPPHSPIRGFRDFLIHLLTITAGLLIALGLEAAVEAVHHRHQVAEAREAIEGELLANQRNVEALLPEWKAEQAVLAEMLDAVQAARNKKKLQSQGSRLSVSVAHPMRSSFDTAQTTGALALMSYDEARHYADIYSVQEIFNDLQHQAVIITESAILGAVRRPFESIDKMEIDQLSPAELDALREKINNYRGQLELFLVAASQLDDKYKGRNASRQ